jgi:hypothetical protein
MIKMIKEGLLQTRQRGRRLAAIGLALLAASIATQNVAREVPSPDGQAATL